MSKRVQRYECGECGSVWPDDEQAKRCERSDREERQRQKVEKLWREFDDAVAWQVTEDQINQLIALVETWGIKVGRGQEGGG